MFDNTIRDLPLIAHNMGRLLDGVAVDFSAGYVRMVSGQMIYDRKFKLKDTENNIIYVVKNNTLEVYEANTAGETPQLRRVVRSPCSTGDIHLALFDSDEDRQCVVEFIAFVTKLNEEQLQRDSPVTKIKEWVHRDPLAISVLLAAVVYGIVTVIVVLT